jgi:flagellar motor switch protein FliN/FliY
VNLPEDSLQDALLADLPDDLDEAASGASATPKATVPSRDLARMMRRIPVTLTLEVGSASISLQELTEIKPNSVIELDTLAGEPLVIKVNGTPIGRAEVVVSGENYGLRVLELSDVDLSTMTS